MGERSQSIHSSCTSGQSGGPPGKVGLKLVLFSPDFSAVVVAWDHQPHVPVWMGFTRTARGYSEVSLKGLSDLSHNEQSGYLPLSTISQEGDGVQYVLIGVLALTRSSEGVEILIFNITVQKSENFTSSVSFLMMISLP